MDHRIVIIGAGKIGKAISKMLYNTSGYYVTLCDSSGLTISTVNKVNRICHATHHLTELSDFALDGLFMGKDSVLSACPYTANYAIARAALKNKISYFDLTEDRYTTAEIQKMAQYSVPGQIFMPQCGLAPGFIGILAYDLWKKFDVVHSLEMRVGALPLYPSNRLKYNLNWSTEGLINEYSNPSEAIVNGKKIDTIALDGLETMSIDGVEYEAFNTSGGLGTLCETLDTKVSNMNYKTLRYPGHKDLISFLLKDLNLGERGDNRKLLKEIFDTNIPGTDQDTVIALAKIVGIKNGKLSEHTKLFKVNHQEILGENWTAIQITTASGACVAIDLHVQGKLPTRGFVHQEDISLDDFLNNQFGHFYQQGEQNGNNV